MNLITYWKKFPSPYPGYRWYTNFDYHEKEFYLRLLDEIGIDFKFGKAYTTNGFEITSHLSLHFNINDFKNGKVNEFNNKISFKWTKR